MTHVELLTPSPVFQPLDHTLPVYTDVKMSALVQKGKEASSPTHHFDLSLTLTSTGNGVFLIRPFTKEIFKTFEFQ